MLESAKTYPSFAKPMVIQVNETAEKFSMGAAWIPVTGEVDTSFEPGRWYSFQHVKDGAVWTISAGVGDKAIDFSSMSYRPDAKDLLLHVRTWTDTSQLALLDPQGRILESTRTDETYEDFYVADALRKVFTTGGERVCWRTFEKWEKTPVVAGAASLGGPAPAAADVTYKGVPLSGYIRQLKGKDTKAQLDALYAIQQMGPVAAAAVPELIPFLSASDWFVKTAAMKALAEMGPASGPASARLAEALSDANADVRRAAAETLVKLGPAGQEAVPALVARIDEPVPDIRGNVFATLAAIGPGARSAVPALKAYLKREKEQWLRNAAGDALEKIR